MKLNASESTDKKTELYKNSEKQDCKGLPKRATDGFLSHFLSLKLVMLVYMTKLL